MVVTCSLCGVTLCTDALMCVFAVGLKNLVWYGCVSACAVSTAHVRHVNCALSVTSYLYSRFHLRMHHLQPSQIHNLSLDSF